MLQELKKNPLACGLLGIIVGSGGTLGGQALMEKTDQSSNSVNQIYTTTSTQSSSNFDIVPYDPDGDVYITPHGKKYHYSDCYTLNRSKKIQQVSSEKAEEAGLEPCSKCH